jgi:hypothetical protein
MRVLTSLILTAIASGYGLAGAACEAPSPVTMPDGATSTRDQMLAAQTQVRAYQAAMNEFVTCLDSEVDAQGEQAPAEFKSLMVERHNAAVTEMEAAAAAFNEQLRAFRAANPAPAPNN